MGCSDLELEHAGAGGYHTPNMPIGARCVEQLAGRLARWASGAQGRTARGGVDFSAAEGLSTCSGASA